MSTYVYVVSERDGSEFMFRQTSEALGAAVLYVTHGAFPSAIVTKQLEYTRMPMYRVLKAENGQVVCTVL